jgi:membrane-associated phospholipid phosphatase
MTGLDTHPDWMGQALQRAGRHTPMRIAVVTVAISVFMVGYFILLRHPLFPVTLIPVTALDRRIGFEPWSLLPYASLWLYISCAPMLLSGRRQYLLYGSSAVLLAAVGFALFFFWPTAVPAPDLDWSRYPYVAFLKSVDAAGNACPSLHVAYAVLTALWLQRLLGEIGAPRWLRTLNWAWCILIAYSTLATKQHLALDLAAGALLGAALTWPHLLLERRPPA